jgi:hypothetical protein
MIPFVFPHVFAIAKSAGGDPGGGKSYSKLYKPPEVVGRLITVVLDV